MDSLEDQARAEAQKFGPRRDQDTLTAERRLLQEQQNALSRETERAELRRSLDLIRAHNPSLALRLIHILRLLDSLADTPTFGLRCELLPIVPGDPSLNGATFRFTECSRMFQNALFNLAGVLSKLPKAVQSEQ